MSDRRSFLVAALVLLSPRLAPAQELAEWRAQLAEQAVRAKAAADAFNHQGDRRIDYDRDIVVGALRVSFVSGTITERDSAAFVAGLAAATENLRTRFGDAGGALTTDGHWLINRVLPRNGRGRAWLEMRRATDWNNRLVVSSPATNDELERIVLSYAGERLVSRTPSLGAYSGSGALRPDGEMYAEVARRLAMSWSGTARRCAAGAIDACSIVVSPFDAKGDPTTYYDPTDFRLVVTTARLPALGDSAYFAARRRCIEGQDSVCARMMDEVEMPDPFNPMVRGTLLTRAIELGGVGAIARAAEKSTAPPLETLAHIAGVSQDSLLASWHDRAFEALDEERGATGFPLWFASLGWGAVFLFAATRRKYL